ncbi:hypothetical protein ABTB73_19265, partial [Acinetobacter baumannii]
ADPVHPADAGTRRALPAALRAAGAATGRPAAAERAQAVHRRPGPQRRAAAWHRLALAGAAAGPVHGVRQAAAGPVMLPACPGTTTRT